MLVRGARLLRIVDKGMRCGSVRKTSYEIDDHRSDTMDDLPIPSGSWKEFNDAKQRKYNMYLTASIAFFLISFGVGIQTDTLNMYTGPSRKN